MGALKRKRERFFAEHPICCFCGGQAAATTVDHVPARACFYQRAYPEGFEFPACSACQNASRADEQVFAFYVRMMDSNEANFDGNGLDRAITAFCNNFSELLPNPFRDGRFKRTAFRDLGLTKPPNMLASELPVVEFDPAVHDRILRYARKISLALYYREHGRIAPSTSYIWTTWSQVGNHRAMDGFKAFVAMTPIITVGSRPNLDFGDRFAYRCNKADDPDVIALLCQFGQGLVFGSIIIDEASFPRTDDREDWVRLAGCFEPPQAGADRVAV